MKPYYVTKPKSRLTWGVMLRTGTGSKRRPFDYTGPLFSAWWTQQIIEPHYEGEPSRIMIFHTRTHARSFCDVRNASRSCPDWLFYPARIEETWKVLK